MDYYTDYYDKLDKEHLQYHMKAIQVMNEWGEDLESFIYNFIDIDEQSSCQWYYLSMANRWYAIALLSEKIGWDY